MSLTKVIEFRHLITQLTHGERVAFLSELVESRLDIVLSGLFHHFAQSNQINEVNHFNKSLSDIIQSRKVKPETVSTRNIKLHQFPTAIIGYTASFLNQLDYINFSMSNRSIYLGCNSPNLLHALDLTKISDYSSIDLASFPSVTNLQIDPSKVLSSQPFDLPLFNQVMTLELASTKQRGWVQQFLNTNIIDCDTVTTLDCTYCGSPDHDNSANMSQNEFLSLLARFSNVMNLKLYCLSATDDITAQDIHNVCPNIVGLYLEDGIDGTRSNSETVNHDLIALFARKLKYLSSERVIGDFDTIAFDALEELVVIIPDKNSVNGVVQSASNLKKIFVSFFGAREFECFGIYPVAISTIDIKHIITNLFMKCLHLSYMSFALASCYFDSLLEGIECGLLKMKKQHKKELKIEIDIYGSQAESKDFVLSVGRLVNSLETSAINDFMFIWNLCDVDDETLAQIYSDLSNISVHTKVLQRQHGFVITNPNCKINGYRDSICDEYPQDYISALQSRKAQVSISE
eukprot:326908_1